MCHSILSNVIPKDIRVGDFSFVSKIFASTKTLNSIHEAPLMALLDVLTNNWLLNAPARKACQAGASLPEPIQALVPSKG
jgi:hypothetical protein